MTKPESRVAQFLGWMVQVPLAIRLLAPLLMWVATSGLYTVTHTGDEERLMSWPEALHSSLRVFVLDPPAYPIGSDLAAVLLWFFIFAAPLVTTAAVADFVRAYVLSGEVLARGYAGHVVVCGAGEHGTVIGRRAANEGYKVVLLDRDAVHTGLMDVHGFDALVVRGNMVDSVDLEAACVQTASHVFFASGDPLVNLRGAAALRGFVPQGPLLHVLADADALPDDMLVPLSLQRTEIIDQFGVAARSLATTPRVHARLAEAKGRVDIAIVGFGRFGMALLRELQQLELKTVSVTLIDRKGRDKAATWNETHSSPWRVVGENGGDAMRWVSTVTRNHEPLDLVFLCLDNDALSLRLATTLRRKLPKVLIVLRVNTELIDGHDIITCSVPMLFDQALSGLLSSH